MRRNRVCVTYPIGTTIEETGPRGRWSLLWTKIGEDVWCDGSIRDVKSNNEMDELLTRGAEVIIVDKELPLQPIPAYDLEAGDYVIMRWGFWDEIDEPLFDPNGSQWLWHVAGWHNNTDGNWTVILDASEDTLLMVGLAQFPDGDFDLDPIVLPVGPDTVFHYVDKDADHERFDDWDWSYNYKIVEPPEVPE